MLGDTYRLMLARVSDSQEALERDHQRLASLSGVSGPDPLLVHGLFLREREIREDWRRLAVLERRTRWMLDDSKADEHLRAVMAGNPDGRLLERYAEQRKVIRMQRAHIESESFQRDLLEDDVARARQELAVAVLEKSRICFLSPSST